MPSPASSTASDWSVDEPDETQVENAPNQLLVSLLTAPPYKHRSRITARKPLAPRPALVKVPVTPWATEELLKTSPADDQRAGTADSAQQCEPSSTLPEPAVDAQQESPPPRRKRPRVPLEEKLRAALTCDGSADGVDEAATEKLVDAITAAIRRCGEDAGLVASLVVNGLSDPLNSALRADVISGSMTPDKLVTLNDEEFLNPQRREELHAKRQERMDQRSVDYLERLTMPVTKMFTCPACGCKECFANFRSTDFVKWQGDDPNPTLLTCTKCGLAFKM